MPTFRRTVGNIQLTSGWKAREAIEYVGTQNYGSKKLVFASGPTLAQAKVSFPYSLPSGAVIDSAYIWATINNGVSGCSIRDVNGMGFTVSKGAEVGVKLNLTSWNGVYEAVFRYKANGSLKDTNQHYSTITFTNVYLEINYNGGVESEEDYGGIDFPTEFKVPPQNVCIYDQTDSSIYLFDGVMKISHSLSMDMQEEVGGDKAVDYVNNAKNQPDKLTLDIVMSDAYTDEGPIIQNAGLYDVKQQTAYDLTKDALMKRSVQSPWTRSESAYHTIHWLKEQRRKLSVITPQFVYADMILVSVTVTQDDGCPYGFEGQLGFQHAFVAKKKKQETKGGKDGNSTPDVSNIKTLMGSGNDSKNKAGGP